MFKKFFTADDARQLVDDYNSEENSATERAIAKCVKRAEKKIRKSAKKGSSELRIPVAELNPFYGVPTEKIGYALHREGYKVEYLPDNDPYEDDSICVISWNKELKEKSKPFLYP